MIPAHINACPRCREYAEFRSAVVAPHLAARKLETGETNVEIVTRYMTGVHDRHLAGHWILHGEVVPR